MRRMGVARASGSCWCRRHDVLIRATLRGGGRCRKVKSRPKRSSCLIRSSRLIRCRGATWSREFARPADHHSLPPLTTTPKVRDSRRQRQPRARRAPPKLSLVLQRPRIIPRVRQHDDRHRRPPAPAYPPHRKNAPRNLGRPTCHRRRHPPGRLQGAHA